MRWVVAILALAGCVPELPTPANIVTSPTLIAVTALPAEVRPGRAARYTAVIAGLVAAPSLAWSWCDVPRPLGEEGAVAPSCAAGGGVALPGSGLVMTASVPVDACRIFGPDPPPGNFRAQDPDLTGGYYQPLMIRGVEPDAVFTHRIACGLARAPVDVARQFTADYHDNVAPPIASLTSDGDALELRLEQGARETYPVLPPGADALETRTETLVVSWWATAGTLAVERAAIDGDVATTEWRDAAPGARAWAVVRDDRGGVAVAEIAR